MTHNGRGRRRPEPRAPCMNKAFTREPDGDDDDLDDDEPGAPLLPPGTRNYITPAGYQRLRAELLAPARRRAAEGRRGRLVGGEERRPLGERRLPVRQEAAARDRPAHPLPDQAARHRRGRRPGAAPRQRPGLLRRDRDLREPRRRTSARSRSRASTRPTALHGEVSWVAPIARALLKARVGDEVQLMTPGGPEQLEVLEVRYPAPDGG